MLRKHKKLGWINLHVMNEVCTFFFVTNAKPFTPSYYLRQPVENDQEREYCCQTVEALHATTFAYTSNPLFYWLILSSNFLEDACNSTKLSLNSKHKKKDKGPNKQRIILNYVCVLFICL